MISLISMAVNAIISFFIYVLKAFFSMLFWFCGFIFKLLRLFFCALPFTAVAFAGLAIANVFIMFTGIPSFFANSEAEGMLLKDTSVLISLIGTVRKWWIANIYAYNGSAIFFLLLILTVIMFIPVACILLGASVFMAFGQLLVYCLLIDMAIYLVRILFGKSFVAQFLARYYRLFPASGQKHREKSYEKWLKANQKVFEGRASFYGDNENAEEDDDFYEDAGVDDFYKDDEDGDYDGEYDDEYDDDYYEDYPEDDDTFEDEYDDEYDSEEYGEYEEDYGDEYSEDDEDDEYEPEPVVIERTTFDFFAGCTSKESLDRKYKSLVKLYHPDNEDGDTAALQEINIQYTNAKKKFS